MQKDEKIEMEDDDLQEIPSRNNQYQRKNSENIYESP